MNLKRLLFLLVGPTLSCLVYYFRLPIMGFLDTSLPFREAYIPTFIGMLYVYMLPILFGVGAKIIFPKSFTISRPVHLILSSLLVGAFLSFPLIIDRSLYLTSLFNNLTVIFYIMLTPFMFMISIIFFDLVKSLNFKNWEFSKQQDTSPMILGKLSPFDICIMALFAFIIFLLNLYPFINSHYPVGADIYYHIAMITKTVNIQSILHSPFFLEDKNYYISFVYIVLASIAKFFNQSSLMVYGISICLFSSIFVSSFYSFSKKIFGKSIVAILATLFVFSYSQTLWPDPSLRIYGYTFLILFLNNFLIYQATHKLAPLFLSLLFFILTIGSHPELAVQIVLIMIFYLFFRLFRLPSNLLKLESPIYSSISFTTEAQKLLIMLFLYFFVLQSQLTFLFSHYLASRYLLFNEIGFGVIQPFGVISFLVLLFFPFGILNLMSNIKKNALLLSVSCLYLSTFFYFTYLWIFYHRYFAETGYLIFACVAANVFYHLLLIRLKVKEILLSFFVVVLFLLLSIQPKYSFISQYTFSTNLTVDSKMTALNLISNYTSPNAVVMVQPDSIINRYIPYFTNRYIFAGSSFSSKEHQWQVLSFCNGPFSKSCDARVNLVDTFYKFPSLEALRLLQSQYRIDYIMLDSINPVELNILNLRIFNSLPRISTDKRFYLYKI